jgi:NET1-associated nuclear protein 1 (U3 small nucleolar RNA-associated protein 17)
MATIDSRQGDEAFRGEVFLKVWWWNPKTEFWTLNTRIDRPHGLERVTSVAFSPEVKERLALQLATTGDDRAVKIWRLRSKREKNKDVEGLLFRWFPFIFIV